VLHYYIGINSKRFGEPMTKEEALLKYLEFNKILKGVVILIYDENDKLKGQIPKKKTT
jgi:hypothetical protein